MNDLTPAESAYARQLAGRLITYALTWYEAREPGIRPVAAIAGAAQAARALEDAAASADPIAFLTEWMAGT